LDSSPPHENCFDLFGKIIRAPDEVLKVDRVPRSLQVLYQTGIKGGGVLQDYNGVLSCQH
jgi:hypothetical protein